jgi:hypothetical protein
MEEVIFENQSNEVEESYDCENNPKHSNISAHKAILAVVDKVVIRNNAEEESECGLIGYEEKEHERKDEVIVRTRADIIPVGA